MKTLNYDFIVVGSGLAGLLAAFHAADYGTVALISKSELDISNSYHAQGGIAVAIGEDDDPDFHFKDTLVAGRDLCDHDSVKILVTEGLERVKDLIRLGMEFDKENDGNFKLGLEGGHSKRRVLHADGDATGKMTTSFMLKKVSEKPGITPFEFTTAVKILVEDGICKGVQALQYVDGENIIFTGKAIILATGGLSRLYCRSTNPYTATGDGIALAWQAGVRLADMEFIQFHPTALDIPGQEAYLISEAVRGEGAYLLDANGVRFMTGLHPLAELAPRDVVASAIFNRIQETGSNVYLSLQHLDKESIIDRFHSIYAHLKTFDIDITHDLVPVAPAAHYFGGGIRTDIWGQTNITGLFACGEVAASGVMGANRLASNSLLECLVYSKRVIEKAHRLVKDGSLSVIPESIVLYPESDNEFLEIKNELANIMTNYVGIVRNEKGMRTALAKIEAIACHYANSWKDYNYHKIINLTDICRVITLSALERRESRGGHVRTDYPDDSRDYLHHIIQEKGKEIQEEPVRVNSEK
jgi:L-aspartate oxidase